MRRSAQALANGDRPVYFEDQAAKLPRETWPAYWQRRTAAVCWGVMLDHNAIHQLLLAERKPA